MAINTDWAERIGRASADFTRTEAVLMDYLTRVPHEAAFMSLGGLCEASGISKPVVIDFYRKLGYKGFKEFREGLQTFYAQHIDSYRASTITFRSISTIDELIENAIAIDGRSLRRLAEYLSKEELESVARRLLAARRIYLYGPGTGFYPAHYLFERLKRYRLDVHLVGNDVQHLAEELFPVEIGDQLLAFDYLPKKDILERVMSYAADAGAGSILVSDQVDVRLVNSADTVIVVNRGEINFKNSMAVPMAFANLLLLTIELIGGDQIHADLMNLEDKRERFGLSYFI
jgi:DNA-binding MurR/RpiR family transcriptional regulator